MKGKDFGRATEIIFGLAWLIIGIFKFWPDFGTMATNVAHDMANAAIGQPLWLSGWFSFWANLVAPNAAFFAWFVGVSEILLGIALIVGFLRKIAYSGGIVLSLLIWSTIEGFGGPYGIAYVNYDIGGAVGYAFAFMFLISLNYVYKMNTYTLDSLIEKRIKWWVRIAEIKR